MRLKKIFLVGASISIIITSGCLQASVYAKSISPEFAISNLSASSKKSVSGFFSYLKSKGFKLGKQIEKDPVYIGALEGKCYVIDGSNVEVYRYDTKCLTDTGKKYYNSAKSNGYIEIMTGYKSKVYVNGELVLFIDNGKSKNKIINMFKQY